MHRRAFTAVEIPIALGAITVVAGLLMPVFSRARDNARRASCQSNLKQLGLAVAMYTQDFDEQEPIVSVNKVAKGGYDSPYGWADAIMPYVKSRQVYQCPSDSHPPNASKNAMLANYTDYWYNSQLSGKKSIDIVEPSQTLMMGDGNDGRDLTNARYSKSSLPAPWFTAKTSPAKRHTEGANYAWADGHVKWFSAEAAKSFNNRVPGFLIK